MILTKKLPARFFSSDETSVAQKKETSKSGYDYEPGSRSLKNFWLQF
jgi:hypothetical protein